MKLNRLQTVTAKVAPTVAVQPAVHSKHPSQKHNDDQIMVVVSFPKFNINEAFYG